MCILTQNSDLLSFVFLCLPITNIHYSKARVCVFSSATIVLVVASLWEKGVSPIVCTQHTMDCPKLASIY